MVQIIIIRVTAATAVMIIMNQIITSPDAMNRVLYVTFTHLHYMNQFAVTPLAALISSIKKFFFFKTNGKLTVQVEDYDSEVIQGSCVSALASCCTIPYKSHLVEFAGHLGVLLL